MESQRSGLWRRTGSLAAALTLCLGALGCNQPIGDISGRPADAMPRGSISVHQLARRLGLRVDQCDRICATLRNSGNTVLIFAGRNGRVFVNGRPTVRGAHVAAVRNVLFVSESLAGSIQPALRGVRVVKKPSPPLRKLVGLVVLDPGHGGRDEGTHGFLHRIRRKESDLNLTMSLKVAQKLGAAGVRVVLTRSTDLKPDVKLELEERAELANRLQAALFVSIHANFSPTNRLARGYWVFVARKASAASVTAAEAIARRLTAAGIARYGSPLIRRNDYRVLVKTRGPAVLVEMGFMSNAGDLANLHRGWYQDRLAESIAGGIVDALRR